MVTDPDQVVPTTIEFRGITKSYPGVKALAGVDLTLTGGRITGLAGENGAGKSTLIKVLSGAVTADAGTVSLDGRELPADPRSVIDGGISVIYQELTDVPDMSVADNLLLGRLPSRLGLVRRKEARGDIAAALHRVGLQDVNPRMPAGSLSIAQRQLLEIARCLVRNSRVLVFDEPTSALPEADVENLMTVIEGLRHEGLAILYISHHLDEFMRIADEITVLRDGEVVETRQTSEWNEASLVKTMLAKDLEHAFPWRPRAVGDIVLKATGIEGPGVHGAELQTRRGEIVGLLGLAGAGRTELMRCLSGVTPRTGGTVEVDGVRVKGALLAAREAGIVYVPEDRKRDGLVIESSISDNMMLGNYSLTSRWGMLSRRRAKGLATRAISGFGVKASSGNVVVGKLSGGNQQKVVLARVAAAAPAVILLDDPTRGVDVGAKASIYENVLALADAGASVLLASSDSDEVLAMSDRCYVVRQGRIVHHASREDYDRNSLLHAAAAGQLGKEPEPS